jgi:hypothetical protein|tara:strand:+ start:1630 stop:2256 length:627 start_codon:yes stop_codon:yes gene_type:complete
MNKNTQNGEIVVTDKQLIANVNKMRKAITKKHKKVSGYKTPKPYIKQKMGMDYVEYSYMREIADKEYPGWSWTVIKTENLGSEAFVVHGRLKWYDEGIWREGDMVAAHRIQKKRGTNEFVDIGNDIKASNTDCIKKAFNMYLNIADDVYRNQVEDVNLTDNQKDEMIEIAASIGDETLEKIKELIKDQTIHTGNYNSSLAKLKRQAGA